jgi:hypothetical protein
MDHDLRAGTLIQKFLQATPACHKLFVDNQETLFYVLRTTTSKTITTTTRTPKQLL